MCMAVRLVIKDEVNIKFDNLPLDARKKLAAQKRTLPIPTEHDYAYGRESNLNVIALVPSGFSLNPSFC